MAELRIIPGVPGGVLMLSWPPLMPFRRPSGVLEPRRRDSSSADVCTSGSVRFCIPITAGVIGVVGAAENGEVSGPTDDVGDRVWYCNSASELRPKNIGDRGPATDFWTRPAMLPVADTIRRIEVIGLKGSRRLDPSRTVLGVLPELIARLFSDAAWSAAGRGILRREAMLAGGGGDLNESMASTLKGWGKTSSAFVGDAIEHEKLRAWTALYWARRAASLAVSSSSGDGSPWLDLVSLVCLNSAVELM